jgi:predicted phage-related endonuclease
MSYTVIDVPQRSPEWFAARIGRVTGSVANEMLMVGKGGAEAAGRRNLRVRLALERITGKPQDDPYTNGDMKRGEELEGTARELYEAATGFLVETTGFLCHSELMAGCSLDGHVGDMEGIVDFKCPRPATHLEYMRSQAIPTDYTRQLTHNLWVSGAKWADMVSYCAQFPEEGQLVVIRLKQEDADLKGYELALKLFLVEVEKEEALIRSLMPKAVAA